jgi:hypothetical protein
MRSARVLAATLLTALVLPAAAGAQSALQPLPQAVPEQQTTVVAPTTSSSSSGGLSTGAEIAMFGGGVILIGLIGYFIWRDSRRRAPVLAGATGFEETKTTPHAKKQVNRAKAKRAKAARKRNR